MPSACYAADPGLNPGDGRIRAKALKWVSK